MRIFFAIVAMMCSLLLAGENMKFANVSIPVICIRDGKSHASQLISQAVLGTPMQVVDDSDDEWWKVVGPDGYEGYVNRNGLACSDDDRADMWRSAPKLRIKSVRESTVYDNDRGNHGPRNIVTTLTDGSILGLKGKGRNGNVNIMLPDGRTGYVSERDVVSLHDSAPLDYDSLLDFCYSLMGTPYLWGGCSTKSMDCSGLVRVAFGNQGILLPRDAKDQFNAGMEVESDLKRGDLLFFSTTPDGNINHVAIYDGDGRYIHCSGMVKTNIMSEDDPDFGSRVYRGARRIADGSPGTINIGEHSWY